MWFAAHIILVLRLRNGAQDEFPVWENVVLIEADNETEAQRKADLRGRGEVEDPDPSLTLDGEPATWHFVGIRKIVRCNVDVRGALVDGSEVTFSEFLVSSEKDLADLVTGEPVDITYTD